MKLTRTQIEECVRYVHAGLVQQGTIHLPKEVVEQLSESYYEQSRISTPLKSHERAIVTLSRPKTAALFADRVWSVGNPTEDSEITFGWEDSMDVRWRALFDLALMEAEADGTMHQIENAPRDPSQSFMAFLGDVSRNLAANYGLHGANVAPLYDSAAARDAEYKPGDQAALQSIADGVIVVNEDALAWDHVRQFRRDAEARTAYRRFVHWLDGEMVGKSSTFVADDVAARYERYEWSLRKHGIETVIGALESIINPGMLVGASAVGSALQFVMNQPIWSLMAAGGLALGSGALSLARIALARRDIALSHREIAYVQEIKRQFRTEAG